MLQIRMRMWLYAHDPHTSSQFAVTQANAPVSGKCSDLRASPLRVPHHKVQMRLSSLQFEHHSRARQNFTRWHLRVKRITMQINGV